MRARWIKFQTVRLLKCRAELVSDDQSSQVVRLFP